MAEATGGCLVGSKSGGSDFAFLGIGFTDGIAFAFGGGPTKPVAVGVIKGSTGATKENFALP